MDMCTARVGLFALAMAFVLGCSSSEGEPTAGGAGSSSSGGTLSNIGGAAAQAGAGAANGGVVGSSAGTGGGLASGGNSGGGKSGGGGSSGMSNGGTSAAAGAAGRANGGAAGANGGAAGANGGSGGASGCVQNLACKLSPPPSTGDIYQDCVDRINQFLTQCACLPALARRTDGEACADQMAEYDAAQNSAHAGAIAKICQPGGSQNECPGYSSNSQVIGLCMQQMWDEGPPPTATCSGTCYEEHGHFINMTDPDVKKVACGFFTTSSGKVWAVQNFSR